MRVAVFAASGQLGGAERMVIETVRALTTGGVESSVFTLERGPLLDAALGDGAHTAEAVALPRGLAVLGDQGRSKAAVVLGLLRASAPLPLFVRRVSRQLQRQSVDLIHSHGIKTHVLTALLPHRWPLIWHLHDYVSLRPMSCALLGRLARRCDLVIAVSESVAADARQWLPAGVPVVVLHNAVDTDRFTPAGAVADLDALSGLPPAPPGTLRVGLPATFARWKGHEVFLRTLAALSRRDVRGYLIGGPVYQTGDSQWSISQLRDLVAALGLQETVGLTGFLEDMPAAYRALDIVVHASTRPEPFGLVIPEAMACGRLVVATRSGGVAELFEHDVQAVGLSVADVPSMAAAIGSLLSDPDRRAAIAARARAHVIARFGRERFATGLRDAMARVVRHDVPAVARG